MENYLKKAPRLEPVTYITMDGEEVNTNVLMIPAIVKSVPAGDGAVRENKKGTLWRLITVGIYHPKAGYQERNAQLFENSYTKFPDAFAKDGQIELMVQTEGDGKGLAKAQLQAIERIDIDAWNYILETNLEEQLVDEELVA